MSDFGKKVSFYRQHIVRVCFQMVTSVNREPCINVDMGKGNSWDGKTTLQLNIHECSLVIAYFLKIKKNVFVGYHGASNSLGLHIAPQDKKQANGEPAHYLAFMEGGVTKHFIFLQEFECFGVFNLVLEQLANHYRCPKSEVIELIKIFYLDIVQ